MSLIRKRVKKVNPELEREKRLAASRGRRTDRVVASLAELQERNQFREQLILTLKGRD